MKQGSNEPRLLTTVMEAIANLKEGNGSTQKKIIDQVQFLLDANNVALRNSLILIKKAIKQGVQSGLIKQKGGKFKLGLDSRDYAIFKNFQKIAMKKDAPFWEHKRGRRKRKKSRRKKRRRSFDRGNPDEYGSVSGSGSADSMTGTPEPTDKGRKKKRKKRKRRGRRRTEEREWSSELSGSENKEISPSVSTDNTKSDRERDKEKDQERDRSRDGSRERSRDRSRERSRDRSRDSDRDRDERDEDCDEIKYEEERDDLTCGNPNCLCNLKQEMSNVP